MKRLVAVIALVATACSQPAAPPAEAPPPVEAPAPVVALGPYTNSWDAAEFSRFRHTLNAESAGAHTLTLQAQTDSSGGETVAVYPIGPDGERRTVRIVFVVADGDGTTETANVDIPAEGLPVEVVVENAGGRRHAGSYTLAVGEAPPPAP